MRKYIPNLFLFTFLFTNAKEGRLEIIRGSEIFKLNITTVSAANHDTVDGTEVYLYKTEGEN